MEDFVEVRKYIYAGLRWWWLIILCSVVGGLIGFEVSKRQTPIYRATTAIIVGQSIQSTDLTKTDIQTSELLALTYADIAQRQPVLQNTIKALNLSESEQALKKRVEVNLVEGTQLLELNVEADSPEKARIIADEMARQLILQSPTVPKNKEEVEKQQFVKQQLESLRIRIKNGQQRLATLENQMGDTLSVDQLQELQHEIDTLEKLVFEWEDDYTKLLIFSEDQRSPNRLAIIEPANGSLSPVRPKPKLYTFLAGTVGLLLALGFVFLWEYLDNTIKSPDDFSNYLGVPPLGTIRRVKGKNFQDKLITSQALFSPWSEAYRMIRSNIQFRSNDHPPKSIIITSALPGEGKSTTAANLAIVMAQAELKTVIVDADLRRPTQHQLFQIPSTKGLTDFLLRVSKPDLNDYLKETFVNNLYVLTSGVLPSNPSELLGSQRMDQLLASLSEFADIVIFDSTPMAAFADAAVLSTKMDGAVLVTLAGQTRLDVVRQAHLNLQQVGANLLGGVLNGVASKEEEYLYQSYYSSPSFNHLQHGNPLTHFLELRRWRQWLPFSK